MISPDKAPAASENELTERAAAGKVGAVDNIKDNWPL